MPPTPDELELLDDVIGRKPCLIQLTALKDFGGSSSSTLDSADLRDLPVIKIKLASGKKNVELIFEELRPDLSPTPVPGNNSTESKIFLLILSLE